MLSKAALASTTQLRSAIKVARGEQKARLVIKNARFLDVFCGEFVHGDIALADSLIVGTKDSYEGEQILDASGCFVVPGFIDAHVHIESSLMTPAHFAASVLALGTTTAIWDPHEIANVKGLAGIRWALAATEGLGLEVFIMLPSCVPATPPHLQLESGAWHVQAKDLVEFKGHPRILGLAEMMDYPSVVQGSEDALSKLMEFRHYRRDGHCPSLHGKELNAYCVSGIHSCHESSDREEAQEKMQKGLHVLIREGSCAKNAKTLLPLVNAYTSAILGLCSDDRNPVDLMDEGHINAILNLGLKQGLRPEDVFRTASFASARAFGLDDRGVIAPGYLGDLCVVRQKQPGTWNEGFELCQVIKRGALVEEEFLARERAYRPQQRFFEPGNNIVGPRVSAQDFIVPALSATNDKASRVDAWVIGLIPNQILTEKIRASLVVSNGEVVPSIAEDILKISVIERHRGTSTMSTGLVRGFGLREGAIATTIAHDCHNIVVVGVDGEAMAHAVNYLRQADGGIVVWKNNHEKSHLALPIAGLMSEETPATIAGRLRSLIELTKSMGCKLEQPFLQLSFLALPVIPALKITDRGLIDVHEGKVIQVQVF